MSCDASIIVRFGIASKNIGKSPNCKSASIRATRSPVFSAISNANIAAKVVRPARPFALKNATVRAGL